MSGSSAASSDDRWSQERHLSSLDDQQGGREPVVHERRPPADMAEELWRRTRDREVRLLVGELDDDERGVLVRRWGLVGQPSTLTEVAAALGIDEEVAARREETALDHLREMLADREDLR